MRRLLYVASILLGAQALGIGCGVLHDSARPAAYGIELAECEDSAHSWPEYSACCVDVATRYGRDPGFCFPKDGGHD